MSKYDKQAQEWIGDDLEVTEQRNVDEFKQKMPLWLQFVFCVAVVSIPVYLWIV